MRSQDGVFELTEC